jgi:hypothetical protein
MYDLDMTDTSPPPLLLPLNDPLCCEPKLPPGAEADEEGMPIFLILAMG